MEAHTCFPGTWETKAGGFSDQSWPGSKVKRGRENPRKEEKRSDALLSLPKELSSYSLPTTVRQAHTHTHLTCACTHTGIYTRTQTHSLRFTLPLLLQILQLIKAYGRFPWFMVRGGWWQWEGGVYLHGYRHSFISPWPFHTGGVGCLVLGYCCLQTSPLNLSFCIPFLPNIPAAAL